MRYLFTTLLCLIGTFVFSQTKKIAFKSHSGNITEFQTALDNDWGDTDNSNFGMAPEPIVRNARLDSLILINDTSAIMVTSEYCRNRRDTKKAETLWMAGKDTVYRHPVFNGRLSLDSIKRILRTQYHFNDPDKTIFIGFEHPITLKRDSHNQFDGTMMAMTGVVFGLALAGGLLAWKLG